MRKSPNHTDLVKAAERRQTAFDMRKRGTSITEIAAHLGVTRQAVSKMLKKHLGELAELTEKDAKIVRQLELDRMDAMLDGLWGKAELGEESAVDRVLRIMERRAKLLGLDQPTRSEVENTIRGGELRVVVPDNGRFNSE